MHNRAVPLLVRVELVEDDSPEFGEPVELFGVRLSPEGIAEIPDGTASVEQFHGGDLHCGDLHCGEEGEMIRRGGYDPTTPVTVASNTARDTASWAVS